MDGTALGVTAAALVAAVLLGGAAIRIVPVGQCAVIVRAARVARVRVAGIVLVLPGVERVKMMPVGPRPLNPVTVVAMTQDGVDLRLTLSVLWRVVDPARAVGAGIDARAAIADVVERRMHDLVGRMTLAAVVGDPRSVLGQATVSAQPLLEPFGVDVLDVDLEDVDIRVGPELLRLLG